MLRALDRAARAVTFYEHGIARLEDRWQDIGETGARFLQRGPSLRARSRYLRPSLALSIALARAHAPRRRAARTLAERAGRRADHPSAARIDRGAARSARFSRGARDRGQSIARRQHDRAERLGVGARRAGEPLAANGGHRARAGIIGGAVWWVRGGPISPLLIVIMLKMILTRPSRTRVARIVRGVDAPLGQLDILADTLALLEHSTLSSPRLAEIRAEMMSHGVVPSVAIRRLKRLADMLDWRRNALFAPIAVAVSWALHLASAIESWRREFGPKVIFVAGGSGGIRSAQLAGRLCIRAS